MPPAAHPAPDGVSAARGRARANENSSGKGNGVRETESKKTGNVLFVLQTSYTYYYKQKSTTNSDSDIKSEGNRALSGNGTGDCRGTARRTYPIDQHKNHKPLGKKMRRPGLEPGTPAWKADMLTPTPTTLVVLCG